MTDNPTLTVRDNRTGEEYELPITDGTISASDLGKVGKTDDEAGIALYDPGFINTASCRSAITFIDGEEGILEYRGYPIEQLAERHVPRGRLPAHPRRAAHRGPARPVGARDHVPHVRAREHQEPHAGVPLRRAPDGHAAVERGRAVDLLPRVPQHPGPAACGTSRSSG